MKPFAVAALAFVSSLILAGAPSIAQVSNGANFITAPGLPNSGLAQGAFLTVKGSGLGPSTPVQAASFPLPTTQGLGGTTIQVTVGGSTENCVMEYASTGQVNAILPSATPVGTGTLTLSYQGASASIAIQVVAANFGTFTLNQGGTGPGIVSDANYNVITYINPAQPGQTLILWGSGLGAVSGDETEPPVQADLGTGVQVLVGGQPATVTYGGRGAFPALDQINFVVPAGVAGCRVSIAVTVKGVTGNITTTSIAPAGQATCGDSFNALTAANLQKAVASGSLNLAGVELSRYVGGNDTQIAEFTSFSLNSLIRSYGGTFAPSVGSCLAYEVYGSSLTYTDPIPPTAYLDAGPALTLAGPGGTKTTPASSTGSYLATLATSPSIYISPGSYTVGNGSGGANVGPFSWGVTLPAYVTPSIPASVNRSQNLTLTWSGGSPYSVVSVLMYSGLPVTSSLSSYVQVLCTANAAAGTFTVPSAFLGLFPANGYGATAKPGINIQIAGIADNHFTVAGSPGLDEGFFDVYVYNGSVATIQ